MASFHLRLPEDLHEMLQGSADLQERSLQREIVFRLRKSFVGEVASAETRERAGATGLSDTGQESRPQQHDRSEAERGGRGSVAPSHLPAAVGPPSPALSLPDRDVRHSQCLKRSQHHIYHGGRPCPLCGYPA